MEIIKRVAEKKSHDLRRMVQRFYIGMKRKTTIPRAPKTPYHNECITIFRRMLDQEDTLLLIAPISNKKYMKNERYGIYLILHKMSMEVINHVYNYKVPMDEKTWDALIEEFNQEMEERSKDVDSEIEKNIKHSLKTIPKSMTKKHEAE